VHFGLRAEAGNAKQFWDAYTLTQPIPEQLRNRPQKPTKPQQRAASKHRHPYGRQHTPPSQQQQQWRPPAKPSPKPTMAHSKVSMAAGCPPRTLAELTDQMQLQQQQQLDNSRLDKEMADALFGASDEDCMSISESELGRILDAE
jgi:hypothetical protein